MVRYTVHFSGRVQGVGFRYTCVQLAKNASVAGYVQNLPDGRVRLVAEGEAGECDALLHDIGRQFKGKISDQSIDRSTANGEFGQPAPGALSVRY